MGNSVNIMPEVVGQEKLKRIFNFHLKSFKKTGVFPTTLLNASMGEGKTMMLECLAEALGKRAFVVNCSSIKNAQSFVEGTYLEEMNQGDDYTIIADEFQVLDKTTQSLLLTLLTPNKEMYNSTHYSVNGVPIKMEFNLRKHTFLAATTNIESLVAPLVDRFRVHSMERYSPKNLADIMKRNIEDDIFIPHSVMKNIMMFIRSNPRSCVMLAQDINEYCKAEESTMFTNEMWEILKDTMSLRPYGLNEMEETLLRILNKTKQGVRLTNLAARMRLDNKTVQSVERYLMYLDLIMNIDGLRSLTENGQKYFNIK